MSREQGLRPDPAPARPHLTYTLRHDLERGREPSGGALPVLAVLIEVPAVRRPVRPARRPSATATARVRAHGARVGTPRPRRRLRRELRAAGYLVASSLPLVLAAALLHGAPVSRGAGLSGASAPAVRPPSVSISIEQSALGPRVEPEPPVVLPGYLLPADGPEEAAHAGG
jgi:hypothetical protein